MKLAFGGVLGKSLDDSNRQPIFSSIEKKDLFAGLAAVFLLPLKHFLDSRMLDYRHAAVVIEEPLDYIGNRINVNATLSIAQKRGLRWRIFFSVGAGR
jgi:hypothetical protein